MSLQETQEGLEILDFRQVRGDMDSSRSGPSYSGSDLLKYNPTSSFTEASCLSTESRSFELEYSDEDLSIISSDDHDKDEESKTREDHDFDLEFPSIRTLDLVIDEMPAIQSRNFFTKSKSSGNMASSSNFCKPVSTDQTKKFMACPCCLSYVNCDIHKKKNNRFPIPPSPSSMEKLKGSTTNVLNSFVDGLWPNQQRGESDTVSGESTSSTVKSMGYTIKRRVMEGWLHKKGTGNDLFRSTCWKPRWCSLVMTNIPGYEQDVPLLLVSWHVTVKPSNIIMLESSIAISVDQNATSSDENDNNHCFDIVSRNDCDNNVLNSTDNINNKLSNGKLTKTFSAELEQRDEWVSKINESVRAYEKSKRLSVRQNDERLLPPTSPTREISGKRLRNIGLNGLSIAW